jgi:uncharacterized protein YjiS (DUF1127 family)
MGTLSNLSAWTRPLPLASVRRLATRLFVLLVEWDRRGRERRHLRTLDDRALADLGLTRADILPEIEKRFWQS